MEVPALTAAARTAAVSEAGASFSPSSTEQAEPTPTSTTAIPKVSDRMAPSCRGTVVDVSETRAEHDSMGDVEVPRDALWRAQTQRAIDNFPISGLTLQPRHIQALAHVKAAAAHANEDVSRGLASYFLWGKLIHGYADAFASQFKQYGIRPVPTGCLVCDAELAYWNEYNRVVRGSLVKKHGKDLIQEFETSYWSHRVGQ